jgi:hypothetical protein
MVVYMNQHTGLAAACLFSLTFGVALQGCVVVPDQGHDPGGIVMVAPPPARDDAIGVAPVSGYIWFAGYWDWVGGRYEWVPGHWAAGRQGYHWVAHQWVRQGDGWRMKPGHWSRG